MSQDYKISSYPWKSPRSLSCDCNYKKNVTRTDTKFRKNKTLLLSTYKV